MCVYVFTVVLVCTINMNCFFHKGTLPHDVTVKGLPVGVYSGLVRATDVFGSIAESAIQYQGEQHGNLSYILP